MRSPTPAAGAGRHGAADLELLRIEIELLWPPDDRGRIAGTELVIASSLAGCAAAIGTAVPDDLAAELAAAVAGAAPPADLSAPPPLLDHCRRLLEARLGPVALRPGSGPSYLIPEQVASRSDATLVRSDDRAVAALRGLNPGTWEVDEWEQLLDGRLGPWVMAVRDGKVVSICHTPARSPRAAEAGVWTRPEYRGRGYAAAATAAWAALLRPGGRVLFYSTSRTNVSSQRVAARLALRPLGWLWQLARPQPPRP
jgi:RimJ/RimL family protein N-acetyltransferase